jgi:DNA-binding CsgD family transcriptional regulator
MLHTPPLIGRERDLAVALEQLKSIDGGGSASVLVRGEAGIGKSRLARELLERAAKVDIRTLVGRADDFDRGIPYALFRDVLARLDPSGDVIVEFRAGLDAGIAGAPADAHLSLVLSRAVELFRELTAGSPTVLLAEDVHLADADSLALLALLVRLGDLPMLTVATARPPLTGPGRDLERLMERAAFDGRGAVVDLEPLDRHDVHALVSASLDAVPDARLVDAALAASSGNPFFAYEGVRALHRAGSLVVEDGRARLVPDAPGLGRGPNAALVSRVFGQDHEARELAKVLSAFGRFPLRHLPLAARLTGEDEATVTAAFDRLVSERVVIRDDDGAYTFAHGIVRDAVYEDVGPAERRRLHAAIAAELSSERRAGAPLDAAELATHVAESADPGDDDAIEVLLGAARAVSTTAPLVAAEHYARAIALLPPGSPRRADALALRARALHIGSRPPDAAAAALEALDDLPPGPQRRATVALAINGLNLALRVGDALALIDSELADGRGPACPLLSQRVHLLLSTGRAAEAAAALPDALAALEGAPPPAQMIALGHLVIYATDAGETEVVADVMARLEALAGDGPVVRRVHAHETIAFADRRPGLVTTIAEHLEAAAALRENPALPGIAGHREVAEGYLAFLRGEWDAVMELWRTAGFDADQRGATMTAGLLRSLACDVELARGRLDRAGPLVEELGEPIEEMRSTVILHRARLALALDDADAALDMLRAQAARAAEQGTLLRRPELLAELAGLVWQRGLEDEARRAAAQVAELAADPGRFEAPLADLALRAILDRDEDAARAHLELAAREGIVFEVARAELTLGELAAAPGEHLTNAYRGFDALGAAPWRRRAATALRTRGLTVPRPAQRPGGTLTDAEAALVRLVRDGLTNRQIATALHYSPKTVEAYLSRIYAKTECASRVQLIRAVDAGTVELPA